MTTTQRSHTHPGEPSIEPTFERGRLLTQADVAASLRRTHRASIGRARSHGCLVEVDTKRFEDGRSMTTRFLLAEARALRASLDLAIAEAEQAQAKSDAQYRDHPYELEVAG